MTTTTNAKWKKVLAAMLAIAICFSNLSTGLIAAFATGADPVCTGTAYTTGGWGTQCWTVHMQKDDTCTFDLTGLNERFTKEQVFINENSATGTYLWGCSGTDWVNLSYEVETIDDVEYVKSFTVTAVMAPTDNFPIVVVDCTNDSAWVGYNYRISINISAPQVNYYTVTYVDGLGNTLQTFADQAEGIATPTIANPERTGFTFGGWTPSVAETVTETITYTATWNAIPVTPVPDPDPVTYTVTFDEQGGSPVDDQIVNAGEYASNPTSTKENYKFLRWELNGSTFDFGTPINENIYLVAVWELIEVTPDPVPDPDPVTYTITYTDGVSGEAFDNQVFINVEKDSDTPDFVGTPERDGYNFTGWSPEVADTVTGDITYTAQWEKEETETAPSTYIVRYVDGVEDEVVFANDNHRNLAESDDTPAFTGGTPTREGYTFVGWDPVVATYVAASDANINGVIEYTAQWTPIDYTITYELDDGTNDAENPDSYTIESEDITLKDPTKDGYEFKGWQEDEEYTTGIPTGSTGDRTFTAVWEKVEEEVEDEEEDEEETTTPTTPTDPTDPTTPEETTPEEPTTPTTPVTPVTPITPVAVTPVEPEQAAPAETITEPEVPLAAAQQDTVEIDEPEVPLVAATSGAAWALVNLLLAIATCATSVILLIGYFINRKAQADEDEYATPEEAEEIKRENKGLTRIFSILPAVVAAIFFVLTENMLNPMILVDKWTLAMLLIALIQVAVAIKARKEDKDEEGNVYA